MKKNILLRTNLLVCFLIIAGFAVTAVLSYQANYDASVQNIEQVSSLTSEGIYDQLTSTFTKPVNISLTMANDSLLKNLLLEEREHLNDDGYVETVREYLGAYRQKYRYDSVFLISAVSGRYYNFNGLDRVLTPGNPENIWYYDLLDAPEEYSMNVDNDEASQNEITVFVNCKLRDDSGATVGIVGVGVRIDGLQSLLQGYRDQFDVNAYLVSSGGRIEISADHTGYENQNFFDLFPYTAALQDELLGWRESENAHSLWAEKQSAQDASDFIVTRYIPELDWNLIVRQDTGGLLLQLRRHLIETVLVIGVILTVILLVITFVIRGFNRQIVTLTQNNEQERRTVFQEATEHLFENIYELDITRNRPANRATAQYFESLGAPPDTPYDKALQIVAQKQIKQEFQQGYLDTFAPENVLRAYREGRDSLQYDFMITTGGDYYWMRITARIARWESDGSIHMLTYRQNIDAEKRQEHRMQLLAQTDEMTGLLTKTATGQQIGALLRDQPNRPFCFYILDIDNFKQANDRHGHAFGDSVILSFTKTIRRHFRSDDLLGRLGGDEFAAFIRVPSEEWALKKAAELSDALQYSHTDGPNRWNVSSSIGLAFAPRDGTDFETLYKHADAALYRAKRLGKNRFSPYSDRCDPPESK